MKLYKLLLCSALVAATMSCDDNNIGSAIVDVNTHIVVDSTFVMTGESVQTTSIISRSVTQLLGNINVPEYGSLESDFVTEFMPVTFMDTIGVTADDIKSVQLSMIVPMGCYTGDSIAPMRVDVYGLKERLPYPIHSDYNPEGSQTFTKADLLATGSYTMSMLGQTDSLYYEDSYTGAQYYYREFALDMPLSLGKDLFNAYCDPVQGKMFADPDAFADNIFKGVYVKTSYGKGRVVQIGGTTISFTYDKHWVNDKGNDTITTHTGNYFGTTPEIVTNNNIRLKSSESIKSSVAAGEVVVQAPAGYYARVKFPTLEICSKIEEEQKKGLTVLNDVTVSFSAEEIANEYGIGVPKYLLLIRESEIEDFFKNIKLPDSKNSYYAEYNSTTNSYDFSIRNFIRQFTHDDVTPTEADGALALVPVDAGFESSSSSSNYYYSYYYTSSTTQTLTTITPQITLPSMVKLNFAKSKIIVSCSKKDFANNTVE